MCSILALESLAGHSPSGITEGREDLLTAELIVGSAPPERAGAAWGISGTGAELGGALGIVILVSIGTAAYRSGLASRLPAASRPRRLRSRATHWEPPWASPESFPTPRPHATQRRPRRVRPGSASGCRYQRRRRHRRGGHRPDPAAPRAGPL
jgi:hypothetical protein